MKINTDIQTNRRRETFRNCKRNHEGYLQVHISDDQLAHAKYLVDHSNFKDGSKYTALIGFLGQTVVADLMGCKRPDGKPDKGFDMMLYGKKVDVKTMERSTDVIKKHYAYNLAVRQRNNDTEYYIFCSVNLDTRNLVISCILPKKVFLRKAKLYGRNDLPKNDAGKQIRDRCGDTLVLLNRDVAKKYTVGYCGAIRAVLRADTRNDCRTPGITGTKDVSSVIGKIRKKAGYENGNHYKGS